ncbi:unnamed protein product [Penicillium camemberti]|uniref:Str. FM013 n=1 Tax=Penicillium camemberti (strain FM 013) TaxID=1429867 RepID=A0A0G4PDS9_PENC3|nr:unnamed protein product [Penicillium camemberti]
MRRVLGPILRPSNSSWARVEMKCFVNYGLVRPPTAMDQIFPIRSVDLQYDDKGWRW